MENVRIKYTIKNPRIVYQGDGKIILSEPNKELIFTNCINIRFEDDILSFEGFYIPKHHELIYGYKMRGNEKHEYIIRVENDTDVIFESLTKGVYGIIINPFVKTNVYLNLQNEEIRFTENHLMLLDYYRSIKIGDLNRFNQVLAKSNLQYYEDTGEILVIKNKPDRDQEYFYLATTGTICHDIWTDRPYDNLRLKFGNVFLTYKDALNALHKTRQLLHEL